MKEPNNISNSVERRKWKVKEIIRRNYKLKTTGSMKCHKMKSNH